VEAAKDVFLVKERVKLLALGAGEDLAVDTPCGGITELPLQVREAGLGGGNFKAADLIEAADAILA
jgi:hypothetical protein